MPDLAGRPLRREITRLAALGEADLGAILDTLDASGRHRVERLLHDYAAPQVEPISLAPLSCSPWLLERVEGRSASLTPATQAALADIAHKQAEIDRAAGREEPRPRGRIRMLSARIGRRR